MANSIDLVVGSEAIKQVENLISKLTVADAELLKISQSAREASKGITAISTPSGLDKAVSNTSALNKELERQNTIIKSLENQIKNLSAVRQSNNKQSAEEVVNQRILNQNALAQAKATSALVGEYQKLDLQHKKALVNAQNLGAKYGETSTQFLKAAEKANTLDTKLKAIDSSLGKNQRNVGNYASGFNALGNSINQLTREAPAFANSMQTGFMAISNNIPALTDAIKGIREQNKALAAEGKPTVSVLSQLGSSFLSWNTLISFGVTLLTVYGGKLVDMVLGLGDVEKQLKRLDEQQKRYNDSLEQANKNIDHNLILEKNRLKQLGASDSQIGALDKEATKRKLKNFEQLRDLNKKELDSETQKILSKKGITIAGFSDEIGLYQKLTSQKLALEKSLGKEIVKFTYLARTDREKAEVESLAQVNKKISALEALGNSEIYNKKKDAYIKSENAVKSYGQTVSETYSNVNTQIIENARKEKKVKREDIDGIEQVLKARGTLLEELDKQIASLQTENILNGNNAETHAKTTEELNKLLEVRRNLNALPVAPVLDIKTPATPEQIEQVKTLTKEVQNYLNSFSSEFMSNAGFTETFDLLNGNIEDFGDNFAVTFNAITESAQEAFNFISGLSQANFEQEYSRLENQKDVALQFAGDSASARAKIEEDTEKKKKEIANRENKAKQKQAIFNIAIDTAQAIMGLWKEPGFPQAIPLAIAIGALGAVQIAAVASQKIPQYWEGTDNHSGGLMLVNDGKDSNYKEKVILPNGNEILPQGRNVLMNAPKGTRVLTHEQQIQEMLNERGISMSKSSVYNGMTASEMDSIMSKHFANIQTNVTNIDEKGFRNWNERNGNKTIRNEVRASRTGFKV